MTTRPTRRTTASHDGGRLFRVDEPTPTERASRRREALAAQTSLPFAADDAWQPTPRACPACSGIGDACSCARTGAQALEFSLPTTNHEGA